jgi:hypothetical protein
VSISGDEVFDYADVEAEVQELRKSIAEQEAKVASLRDALGNGQGACSAHDEQCTRNQNIVTDEAETGRHGKRQGSIQERFRAVSQLQVPAKVKITAIRWLPFADVAGNKRMSKLLVASDNKGSLHIFNSRGSLISSHSTGNTHPITALDVSKKWDGECKIITGHSNGEVRVFTISRPPQHEIPSVVASQHIQNVEGRLRDLRKDAQKQKVAAKFLPSVKQSWEPILEVVSSFFPSNSASVAWANFSHLAVDFTGPQQPIAFVDVIHKSKNSFNILVGDSAGRASLHVRNGSIVSSFQVPGNSSRCAVSWNNYAAVCAQQGIVFYDTRDRSMYPTRCVGYPASPEQAAAHDPEQNAKAEESLKAKRSRRKPRGPTIEVQSTIVSVSLDVASQSLLYAGTDDGRLLALYVRQEGRSLRCTVRKSLVYTHA